MNARTKSRITNTLTALVIIICILQAMRMSYGDAVQQQTTYCQMVSDHTWPDYKHDFKRVCK